jgi:hypothetical protein
MTMKLHYSTTLNDRKEVAQNFAIKMGQEAIYDRHTKSYAVEKVYFRRHGFIEGALDAKQVAELSYILKDWEFADQVSKDEYEEMHVSVSDYAIPDEPMLLIEDITEEDSEDDYSELTYHTDKFDNDTSDRLLTLLNYHDMLIAKALNTDTAVIYSNYHSNMDDEGKGTITFHWFPKDTTVEERAAYQLFIDKLCDKAKNTKVIYKPTIADNSEKYMFSKFLYRLGIDGINHRRSRQILMMHLDGTAWKNLSYKKKKSTRLVESEQKGA